MPIEDGKKLEKKIKDHDAIMESHASNIGNIENKLAELNVKVNGQQENDAKTSKRIDGIAESTSAFKSNIHIEIDEMKKKLRQQDLEILLLKHGQKVATAQNPEPIRVHVPDENPRPAQYDARLNIIIEGLQENEGEDLMKKIDGLCERLGVKVTPEEISSAWRLTRKMPLGKKPNPVKICFRHYSVKERIMGAKWKLNQLPKFQHIWINHDEPAIVRRAKGRARHIASYSRKKGSHVQITPRGIVLDSVFYSYEQLDKIQSIYIPPLTLQYPLKQGTERVHGNPMHERTPDPMTYDAQPVNMPPAQAEAIDPLPNAPTPTQSREITMASPKTPRAKKPQRMRLTKSGLVYSGPSAVLSHLYKATFTIDDTPYNSVEQKLQYEKAMMACDLQAAETIMNTHDTWGIKRIGDKVKVTQEYIDNRLHIACIANEAKYRDNPDLMEVLLDTGELVLIEGDTSSFWAGGEPFDSPAYDNDDSHGKNYQGKMLMNLRTNERARRAGLIILK